MSRRELYFAAFSKSDTTVRIDEPGEVHHLVNVLRKQPGDQILLGNGQGLHTHATIQTLDKRQVQCSAQDTLEEPRRSSLTLCLPLIKAERLLWLVEKATELEVAAFQPMKFDRNQPGNFPLQKMTRRIHEAFKQSLGFWLPEILPTASLFELNLDSSDLILDSTSNQPPELGNIRRVWVGPEGGFSPAEHARLDACGLVKMSLGERRLRTETAAIAAISRLAAWR